MTTTAARQLIIIRPEEHVVLGETEFGMPGLRAIESIGPFTDIQASGPLVTVHDATVDAGLGIGHHPHRMNERLFYIEQGELDHDDKANNIRGHIDAGDVGQFTEGQRGMLHSEWNNGDVDTRAYILVYGTNPTPERGTFGALRDVEAPRYEEGSGVQTKELVGPRSPLRVNGDVRLFADSALEAGSELTVSLAAGEGGLISVREGGVRIGDNGESLGAGTTVIVPPTAEPATLAVRANQKSRVIRVVHGPGYGFIREAPRLHSRTTR